MDDDTDSKLAQLDTALQQADTDADRLRIIADIAALESGQLEQEGK